MIDLLIVQEVEERLVLSDRAAQAGRVLLQVVPIRSRSGLVVGPRVGVKRRVTSIEHSGSGEFVGSTKRLNLNLRVDVAEVRISRRKCESDLADQAVRN